MDVNELDIAMTMAKGRTLFVSCVATETCYAKAHYKSTQSKRKTLRHKALRTLKQTNRAKYIALLLYHVESNL